MLKSLLSILLILTTSSINPQSSQGSAPTQASCSESKPCEVEQLPSEVLVRSFLNATYGYDSKADYKLLSIKWSSTLPNTPVVIVSMGNPAKVQEIYVTPDRQHAIVGKVVPFGADPFHTERDVLNTRAHGPALGPNDSALLLVEFSDLECPACKQVQPLMKQIAAAHPEARFVYESFPLSFHPWAQKAARYAQCVAEVNPPRFFDFLDAVYEKQEELRPANVEEVLSKLAKQMGIGEVALNKCSADAAITEALAASLQLGQDIGVTATPSLFVNGRKLLIGGMSFDALDAIVSYESMHARDPRRPQGQ